MRSLLLLAAVCCLVLSACGSPIARPEEAKIEVVGRQAAAAAAAPAAPADEDDDDDDDDDDVDLDLGDDDDDDDDEEEDEEGEEDDDDDYLERFFDDILGGEDDDDDDDEPSAVQAVVAPADTVAAVPAPPAVAAAAVDEVAAASEEVEAVEGDAALEEEPEAGQKEPASAEVEIPAANAEAAAASDADEEEDEEDDIADALDPEDDEDDEEDEEDDDDDDEDITDALGRNIAKHSRAMPDEPAKKKAVPAIYIVKYNRFVDNILEKMNDVLRRSYEPVSVKLQPIDANKKSTKPKKNKTKSNKKKSSSKKKNSARRNAEKKKEQIPVTDIPDKVNKVEDNVTINEEKPAQVAEQVQNVTSESRAMKEKSGSESSKAKPTTTKPKAPTKITKPKPKPPAKTTTKKPVTKNKVKTSSEKSKPRAKGTLYGLSSLRRTGGDVEVNIKADYTAVKSNFAVGPLILRVEKEVGRGAKKEIKSATATTEEMTGKIVLRINNEGVATLHAIKVLQPKQVRVDSNHERTRELVWRRSSRIAHVVSEKLLSASKPMFDQHSDVKQ